MLYPIFLIGNYRIQVDIFHTFKDMLFHLGIVLLHLLNQLLDLNPFGLVFLAVAGGTGIRKFAGTLDEMKVIIIPPFFNLLFPHKI